MSVTLNQTAGQEARFRLCADNGRGSGTQCVVGAFEVHQALTWFAVANGDNFAEQNVVGADLAAIHHPAVEGHQGAVE